ncbi:hypothetical protein E2C01_039307 [Portunus trituberculatus]|uniref:Uncharacterized protein n=1 Tax=Portunus trituberculatus TaxID=210409 RepID=A0A5B7FKC8_PORTR|nr:hypothetical protein [Portunus trituberculatus]
MVPSVHQVHMTAFPSHAAVDGIDVGYASSDPIPAHIQTVGSTRLVAVVVDRCQGHHRGLAIQ